MKSERRHELKTNELSDWLTRTIEQVQPYSRVAVAVCVAAILLVATFFFLSSQTRRRETEGWDAFFTAMGNESPDGLNQVAASYPSSEVGNWAKLRLADRQLVEGVNLLFNNNRAEARDRLRAASASYQSVLDEAKDDSLIRERALLGSGRAYESLNELDKAIEAYRKLIEIAPKGAFEPMAQRRIDDLQTPPAREFYDWFASQETKPSNRRGGDSSRPGFEFESLPDEPLFAPKIKLDGASGATSETPGAESTPPAGAAEAPADGAAETPPAEAAPTETTPNASEAPAEGAPPAEASPTTETPPPGTNP